MAMSFGYDNLIFYAISFMPIWSISSMIVSKHIPTGGCGAWGVLLAAFMVVSIFSNYGRFQSGMIANIPLYSIFIPVTAAPIAYFLHNGSKRVMQVIVALIISQCFWIYFSDPYLPFVYRWIMLIAGVFISLHAVACLHPNAYLSALGKGRKVFTLTMSAAFIVLYTVTVIYVLREPYTIL